MDLPHHLFSTRTVDCVLFVFKTLTVTQVGKADSCELADIILHTNYND